MIELMEHQQTASNLLSSGKILWGGVGSGKSATVLDYYTRCQAPKDIYVITPAKKRDSLDWIHEAAKFGIGQERDATVAGTITIDSWNNLYKYTDKRDAFFIFDEQRVVGHGVWVRSFIKVARQNDWVLLSATPGDTWLDYAPVFIANGYYANITDFKRKHVLYEPYVKFPKIKGYINERKLELLRNEVLVEMPYLSKNERILNWIDVGYDVELFNKVRKDRWHIYEDRPIKDVAELFRVLKRIVNSDPSRLEMIKLLHRCHMKLVIFYNWDYELELLRTLDNDSIPVFEYNGHRKDPIPTGKDWVYLVQYMSGAEAWNCTSTDAMILYSLTYSYKNFEQCQGRIDRMNNEFEKLYYYVFLSNSFIDKGIKGSLDEKKDFNERKFILSSKEFSRFGQDFSDFRQI